MAAANVDGTPYGDLPDRTLTRPFLLLQSDHAETHHCDRFNNGNGKLLAAMTAPGFRYEIKHANHYSFTDAPFFIAPPGRWLMAQIVGGGRGPAATQEAAADILAAFLTGPLTGAHSDLAATPASPPGDSGRRGGAEALASCVARRARAQTHARSGRALAWAIRGCLPDPVSERRVPRFV